MFGVNYAKIRLVVWKSLQTVVRIVYAFYINTWKGHIFGKRVVYEIIEDGHDLFFYDN